MFGKFDGLDRMVQVLIGLPALVSLLNGIFMLVDPFGWYEFIGTVKHTGPANAHFIRDIGIAYIVCGLLLAYGATNPFSRWPVAFLGNLWLALHGVLHIYEVLTGICPPEIFWQDAPGVLGPSILVIAALAIQLGRQRISPATVPTSTFFKAAKQLAGDSSAYLDDLDKAGGAALESFKHFSVFSSYRHFAPADLMVMSALGATRSEDCGPCVEIVRGMGIAAGLPQSRIDGALAGQAENESDALGFDFGMAIAAGDIGRSAELGEAIEAQFGAEVRTEMTMAASSSRVYPALKRGLGHASACTIPLGAS